MAKKKQADEDGWTTALTASHTDDMAACSQEAATQPVTQDLLWSVYQGRHDVEIPAVEFNGANVGLVVQFLHAHGHDVCCPERANASRPLTVRLYTGALIDLQPGDHVLVLDFGLLVMNSAIFNALLVSVTRP